MKKTLEMDDENDPEWMSEGASDVSNDIKDEAPRAVVYSGDGAAENDASGSLVALIEGADADTSQWLWRNFSTALTTVCKDTTRLTEIIKSIGTTTKAECVWQAK
ncbi:hypothetical protein FI667_g3794, partial [Globisporangium splendens]